MSAGSGNVSYWVVDSRTHVDTEAIVKANDQLRRSWSAAESCVAAIESVLVSLRATYMARGVAEVIGQLQSLHWTMQQLSVQASEQVDRLALHLQWRERAAQIYAAAESSAARYAQACANATFSTCGPDTLSRKISRSKIAGTVPGLTESFFQVDFARSVAHYVPTMSGSDAGTGTEALEAQMQIRAISDRTWFLFTGGMPFLFGPKNTTKEVAGVAGTAMSVLGKVTGKPEGAVLMRTVGPQGVEYIYTDDRGGAWQVGPPVGAAAVSKNWATMRANDRANGVMLRPQRRVMTPRTTDQLLKQMKGPTPQGEVEILKHQTGNTRSWSVLIRGTKEWVPVTGNPHDMLTNMEEVGGKSSDLSRSVVAAMKAAGVAPGEPVELVGHSQGGIVAANLAADPQVNRTYSIISVLTAGSPTAGATPPSSVKMLNLENLTDIVPSLDGRANVPGPGSATVYFDDGAGLPGEERIIPRQGLSPHMLDSYVSVAKTLEEGTGVGMGSGSVNDWMDSRRASLGLEVGTVTTTQHFQTERVQ